MDVRIAHFYLILTALLALTLGGCSDDDPAGPEEFQVSITVRDTLGDPVEGLELTMAPDSPLYMDGKVRDVDPVPVEYSLSGPIPNPFNPTTTIRFAAAQACWVELVIEDVAHGPVRNLIAQDIPAGSHAVVWNGLDDAEQKAPSGVYYASLVMSEEEGGEVLFEGSVPMLFAHWGEGSPTIATTDADGQLVLTDRRLFPYLYDVEPILAVDEVGNGIGIIVLTPTMRFYLTDPVQERMLRFDGDVTGRESFTFTWEN